MNDVKGQYYNDQLALDNIGQVVGNAKNGAFLERTIEDLFVQLGSQHALDVVRRVG